MSDQKVESIKKHEERYKVRAIFYNFLEKI